MLARHPRYRRGLRLCHQRQLLFTRPATAHIRHERLLSTRSRHRGGTSPYRRSTCDAKTYPSPLAVYKACLTGRLPFIVLSHWDYDHYSRARIDQALKDLLWVAPAGAVGPNTKRFADSLPRLIALSYGQKATIGRLRLSWATGPQDDRNNSGIIARVRSGERKILLTGDASYAHIPADAQSNLSAVSVPHHASARDAAAVPDPLGPKPRAIVSCGIPNRYGHPSASVLDSHTTAGWTVQVSGRVPGYRRGNKQF